MTMDKLIAEMDRALQFPGDQLLDHAIKARIDMLPPSSAPRSS